jgi:predicted lipid-binding transport protein (Tim44 family)
VNVTIIILALIAAFLGLRLYSVLGKRTGQEQEPVLPRSDEQRPTVLVPPASADVPRSPTADPLAGLVYEPAAERGIRALLAADRSFDVARFVNGAKAAYRMILEAYWAGDREQLRDLCDADSYAAFDEAISAREARGETLQNKLVAIDRATIVDADLLGGNDARIAVRFEADIAAVTRDSNEQVIAGSMTDAVATTDVWGFRRDIRSTNPNWLLDETDAG